MWKFERAKSAISLPLKLPTRSCGEPEMLEFKCQHIISKWWPTDGAVHNLRTCVVNNIVDIWAHSEEMCGKDAKERNSILWTTRIYSCLSVSICHLWSVSYSSLGMEICQMVVQWFSQIVLLWSIEKWWDFCHRIRKARRVGHGGFGDTNQRAWLVLRLIIIGPRIGQGWQTADYKQMVGIFVDLRNLT
jgi:hypothetical protein